ncbi:MAG TPA: type I 3-dehydroquinate dehydratase [Desulfobulbus sp.]|nr:type I 3-dehydroquinate dehydratase [Desulfobulbus sp.]
MSQRGRICVAIGARDGDAVVSAVRPVLPLVDVVEVRLDAMARPDVASCCGRIARPLLFTNRARWEGGAAAGDDVERIRPLLLAVEEGAAFVDLELRAGEHARRQLMDAIQGTQTRLILSCHDFSGTPSSNRLLDILRRMTDSGAHVGKIITTARQPADVVRVLALLEKAGERGFPLIAFCMGEAGRISRLATLYTGGFMTYVAVDEEQATAPGQLSAARLHELIKLFEDSHAH